MKRRGRRGRRRYLQSQSQFHQTDESWTLKPLHDQTQQDHDQTQDPLQTTANQPNLEQHEEESPSTSHQNLQPFLTISHLIPNTSTPKLPRSGRKPRRGSRNGGVGKTQFVKKSEVGVGSSGSCQGRCEKEEGENSISSDGYVSKGGIIGMNESSYREVNNLGSEDEIKKDLEGERIKGSDSKEVVDEIGSRLEVLLLSGEEPELEEEVLRINDQLQEDEKMSKGCGFFEWANETTIMCKDVTQLKEKLTKTQVKLHKSKEKKMILKKEVKRLDVELVKKDMEIAILKSQVTSNWNGRNIVVVIVVCMVLYDILSPNGAVMFKLPKNMVN